MHDTGFQARVFARKDPQAGGEESGQHLVLISAPVLVPSSACLQSGHL